MEKKRLDFLLGALDMLHIAIGREMVAYGKDLSIEQLDMIKKVVADLKEKSAIYSGD